MGAAHHTTHNTHNAAHNTQHTTHNTQHTTHTTHHTPHTHTTHKHSAPQGADHWRSVGALLPPLVVARELPGPRGGNPLIGPPVPCPCGQQRAPGLASGTSASGYRRPCIVLHGRRRLPRTSSSSSSLLWLLPGPLGVHGHGLSSSNSSSTARTRRTARAAWSSRGIQKAPLLGVTKL